VAGVAATLAVTLVLVGCSSSSSTGSHSATKSAFSTSAAPTGTPIKTMTVTSVNYNGPSYQNILETAKLYGQYINARGGVNGHPLTVETCDDMGNASGTAACARKAVSDGVVADVGSFTTGDGTAAPILKQANIAYFGTCCVISPDAFKSSNVFQLGSNPALNPGGTALLAASGCKSITAAVPDQPNQDVLNKLLSASARAYGFTGSIKFVKVPFAAQDLTAQALQASSGQCLDIGLYESQVSAFLPAYAKTGAKQRLVGPQGNLDATSVKGFESLVKNAGVYGSYPDLTAAPFANYRAAISEFNAPSNLDYNSLGGLGAWTAFTAFTNIVKGMTGTIDAKSFLAAASQTSNLNTDGMVPTINFTKQFTGLGGLYLRAFNLSDTFSIDPANPKQYGGFVNLETAITTSQKSADFPAGLLTAIQQGS
jgi:ABC-type branched-subunit amino acid transport system substrate-binding protein